MQSTQRPHTYSYGQQSPHMYNSFPKKLMRMDRVSGKKESTLIVSEKILKKLAGLS